MYIINNINRPLGIHTYGVQKKYSPTTITEGSIGNERYIDIRNDTSNNRVFIKGKDKRGNYIGNDGKIYSSTNPGRTIIYINKKKNQTTLKPQTFNTARPHEYDKNVEYRWYNGTWQARYTKGKDTNWYNVAEGSTGYDRFGNHNIFKNGKDVAGTYRGSDRRDIANSFNNYYQQQQKTDNNIKNIINNTNQTMNNWRNFTSNLGIFKNGGLISRNPITRFKQGGMLRKLQNGYKIVGTDDQGYPIYQAVDSNVQAQIEAQAAKEVQDFLNSLRASKQQQEQNKQQQEQEFSPIDAINTWKNIITIPKKEVTTKSQKKSSKNNFNKKNKGSQSQKKITVTTTYAKDPAQFPVDPMPPISEYEASQWGRIRTPIVPQQTRPYSLR